MSGTRVENHKFAWLIAILMTAVISRPALALPDQKAKTLQMPQGHGQHDLVGVPLTRQGADGIEVAAPARPAPVVPQTVVRSLAVNVTSPREDEGTPFQPVDLALHEAGLSKDSPVNEAALGRLNAWVNHAIRYRSDHDSWGIQDFYQTPHETLLRRAGDCEDYAILKAALLRRLGVPASAITYLPVRAGGFLGLGATGHMVLVVALPGGAGSVILDSLRDKVRAPRWRGPESTARSLPFALMDDILTGRTAGPRVAARNLRVAVK